MKLNMSDEKQLLIHLFAGFILICTMIGFLFGVAAIISGFQEYFQSKKEKYERRRNKNTSIL